MTIDVEREIENWRLGRVALTISSELTKQQDKPFTNMNAVAREVIRVLDDPYVEVVGVTGWDEFREGMLAG